MDHFGRLDVLVNMASTYRRTPFADLKPADLDEMIATNLAAPYFAAVAAGTGDAQPVGRRAARASRGRSSTSATGPPTAPAPAALPYLTAKGALTTLTMALACELAPEITVNLVQPSTIEPPPNTTETRASHAN